MYGLGYAHAVRFDRYDNLWVVDKGTNAVVKFNPAGYVTLNLGRRPEGYEGSEVERPTPAQARLADGLFNGPDAQDNIYVSEGYATTGSRSSTRTETGSRPGGSTGRGASTPT